MTFNDLDSLKENAEDRRVVSVLVLLFTFTCVFITVIWSGKCIRFWGPVVHESISLTLVNPK